MTGRPMYIAALLYSLLIAIPMVAVVLNNQNHGAGNHWSMFGTPIDRLFQNVGFVGIVALAVAPGVVAVVAILRADIVWGVTLGALCAGLGALAVLFALTVLD